MEGGDSNHPERTHAEDNGGCLVILDKCYILIMLLRQPSKQRLIIREQCVSLLLNKYHVCRPSPLHVLNVQSE